MKHRTKSKSFGESLPKRLGSVKAARLSAINFEYSPHDYEAEGNGKWAKDLRCWKRYRKTQYRQAA